MAFIIVTHFNKTSSISSAFIQLWHCLPLTKLKRSTWDTSGLGEMSITSLLSTLLAVANPSLICTVMRSNESLQASCLMNWNHCKGETLGKFNLTQATLPDSGRENENNKKRGGCKKGGQVFPVFFLIFIYFGLLQIVSEHIWAHLFPHRESPVQLTSTISRETKASVAAGAGGGGCCLCFTARWRSTEHTFSLFQRLSSLTPVHLFPVLLSHLNLDSATLHLQPPALLNASRLPPQALQLQQLPRPGRQRPSLPRSRAQRTQVPEGQQSCTC